MKLLCKILFAVVLFFPILLSAQEVTTLATVTANGGISIDSAGNLFVAHFGPLPPNPSIGKNIYKITPTGEVSLFVENQLNVGSGNSFDSNGYLYQSNFATGAIYKIAPNGDIEDNNYVTIAGPVGITAASDNTLYICSCSSNSVKRITPSGVLEDFATSAFFNCANGITIDDNGNLYTTNFSDGNIVKISPAGNAELLGTTPEGNGHITYRSSDQMLYIASYEDHQIFKMDLSGNVELFAGTGEAGSTNSVDPLEATFNKPNGIEISPTGCSLYISQDGDVVREIKLLGTECITSVPHLEEDFELEVYPNPVQSIVSVEYTGDDTEEKVCRIFDTQGKLLEAHRFDYTLNLDISDLASGVYVVTIQFKNKVIQKKLLKLR